MQEAAARLKMVAEGKMKPEAHRKGERRREEGARSWQNWMWDVAGQRGPDNSPSKAP